MSSGGASRRGGREEDGGVILRAKRRRPPTASDRARAYAFERIPPFTTRKTEGVNADGIDEPTGRLPRTTHRLDSRCSGTDGEQNSDVKNMNAEYRPAPGREASTDRLFATTKHGGHNGGGSSEQGLHLMHPASVVEGPASAPSTVVAPSCKIDLRGCSKRPRPLPLLSAESELERGAAASSVERTPARVGILPSCGRRGRRREVGRPHDRYRGRGGLETDVTQNVSPAILRLGTANTGDRTAGLTNGATGAVSPDLAEIVAPPLQSLRHGGRWRKAITRDVPSSSHPVKSEAQDMDELTSLLRVSRRIFSRAEGFEEIDSRRHPQQQGASMAGNPIEPRGSWRTPVPKTSGSEGVVSAEGQNVELRHCDHHVGGQQSSSGAAVFSAPRNNSALRKSASPPHVRSLQSRRPRAEPAGGSPSTMGPVARRLAIDSDTPLRQGQSSQTTPIRATALEGSSTGRGDDGGCDENAGISESQTDQKSAIEGDDGAHEALENEEGAPALVECNGSSGDPHGGNSGEGHTVLDDDIAVTPEYLAHDDGLLSTSVEACDPTSNENHAAHPPREGRVSPPSATQQPHAERNDATQPAADMNNAWTPATVEEGEYTTTATTRAVVDKAAADWHSEALHEKEEQEQEVGLDDNNGGWAYDEATSSWYASSAVVEGGVTNGPGQGQGLHDSGVDEGWRYDEQTSSWYQDESFWHVRDPQEEEPPPTAHMLPEGEAVATDSVVVAGSALGGSGGEGRETIRRGSSQEKSRKRTLCLSAGEHVRDGLWSRSLYMYVSGIFYTTVTWCVHSKMTISSFHVERDYCITASYYIPRCFACPQLRRYRGIYTMSES